MRSLCSFTLAPLLAVAAGCAPAPVEEGPCGGAGVICHVAGTGEAGFNGDGLTPEATQLYLPSAARLGPDGLLYVMDYNNMRLRCRLEAGVVDTVAGNGVHAIAQPDGSARDSPFENPIDLGFLPDDRLVIVSLHDPRVLRVEHDGTLVSIAGTGEAGDGGDGGPSTEATFQELAALAVAPDGSLFVSDSKANRVRVIRPDGQVYAYAGTGEVGGGGDGGPAVDAQLSSPAGLALDASGNLYVADMFNHRVRRVDAETGVIDTVAGTGARGFAGEGGPALAAELQWPRGVAVAPDGRLYIADTYNHRLRRVESDGTLVTVAGSARGHAGDGGPAVEAQLDGPAYLEATGELLYVADMQNHVVRVLHLH